MFLGLVEKGWGNNNPGLFLFHQSLGINF